MDTIHSICIMTIHGHHAIKKYEVFADISAYVGGGGILNKKKFADMFLEFIILIYSPTLTTRHPPPRFLNVQEALKNHQ